MQGVRDDFEAFFKTQRKGRKLKYLPYFGSCIVKAHFPKVSYTDLVTPCSSYAFVF